MTTLDAGLLILRVVVGVALVGHGTQKLFGWFGGHGRRGTGAFFEMLGYRPGELFAVVAGASEAGGGALLAIGLVTPLAGAAVVGVMLVATSSLRGHGAWAMNGGWEYTVVLATVGATIALTGAGSASVDNALGLDWPPGIRVAGVVLGATAAIATQVLRRPDGARTGIASGADRALDEAA
jgi:putative oxidoreductase